MVGCQKGCTNVGTTYANVFKQVDILNQAVARFHFAPENGTLVK